MGSIFRKWASTEISAWARRIWKSMASKHVLSAFVISDSQKDSKLFTFILPLQVHCVQQAAQEQSLLISHILCPTENLGQLFLISFFGHIISILVFLQKKSARGRFHRREDKDVKETSQSSDLLLQENSQCHGLSSSKYSKGTVMVRESKTKLCHRKAELPSKYPP